MNPAKLVLLLLCGTAAAQNISTIVGGGPHNLQALQTGFAEPSGIALDSTGNLYISLFPLNQIWKVDPSGNVNLFAGTGSSGFSGDGGPATSAALCFPQGLAFDASGNLYVADGCNNRVRKISSSGTITTLAGSGALGSTGDGGPATSAAMNNPRAVAVDAANNVYVVDQGNNRVRVVSSGTINAFAGTGTPSFTGDGGAATSATLNVPVGIAIDSAGSVYIADSFNFRVRKVTSGIITTIAGNGTSGYSGDSGPATSAQLNTLTGLAIDPSQNLYIVEANDVRKIAAAQSTISTFAGTSIAGFSGDGGSPGAATFRSLSGLASDSTGTNFYLTDQENNRIRKIASNVITTFGGNGSTDYNGNGLAATNANVLSATGVAVDNAGSVLFTDLGDYSVRKVGLSNDILSTVAGNGIQGNTADGGPVSGSLVGALAPIFDASGNLYFAEGNRIRKISGGVYSTVANTTNSPGFSGDGGPATAAQFTNPAGLALAQNGDLYIADSQNSRVRLINGQTGIVTTVAGNGVLASSGDGGVATSASLSFPNSVALDGAGNLFIAELFGARIRKVTLSTNIITTVAGDGTFNFADGVAATSTGLFYPYSVFADESSNLFIADYGHARVRKVTAGTNIISTVAGTGAALVSGDGGAATSAGVTPRAVTVDRSQNLYIADFSGRIRTTPVTACFFTLSAPVFYKNSSSGTGSITVTATNPSCPYTVASDSTFVTITSGGSGTGSGTVTFSVAPDPGSNRTATVSVGGASFKVAQAGVFGSNNVGFFQPTGGPLWVLDANGTGLYDSGDKYFPFAGQAGVTAVSGDWNGDGRAKVGYYTNGFWVLDYNGNGVYDSGDKVYGFGGGDSSYVPVVGDWNGDGRTKIGYYRAGFWALDINGNGMFDAGEGLFAYGGNGVGEVPVIGDWNGDHRSKIGYFFNGKWVLDYNGDGMYSSADKLYTNFTYASGDKPVVGDWSGDGKTKIGIYRGGFWALDYNGNGTYDGTGPGGDKFFGYGGNAGEIPIVADWNGSGTSKIGVYFSGFWVLDYNGNGAYDGTGPGGDRFIPYGGTAGNQILIGRW